MAKYNNFIKKTPRLNTVENNSRVVTQRSENPLPYIIARSQLSSLLRKREGERERETKYLNASTLETSTNLDLGLPNFL